MVRMVGGKGKGRGRQIVSLLIEEARARAVDKAADEAVERWLRGECSDSDRLLVANSLVAAEAKIRDGSATPEVSS
jgi:hypothetical protein